MSEFNEILIEALRERQADNLNPDGSCQIWETQGGEEYPCVAGSAEAMLTLGIGGLAGGADLIVIIILEDIVPGLQTLADLTGKIPLPKQTGTFNGKKYRIDSTEIPPGLAFIALKLIDASKGV